MSTYKPSARRDDLPPTDDEIEISPGCLAQAPRRVSEKKAVTSLRVVTAQAREFAQGVAEAQAKLDASRNLALQIQEEYEFSLDQRAGLLKNIAGAEAELAVSRSRMVELDAWIRQNFGWGPSLHEQIEEFQRREFLADPSRLPAWILEWKIALGVGNERIAAFEKLHGCGEK